MVKKTSTVVLSNDPSCIKPLLAFGKEVCLGAGLSGKEAEEVALALREAATNVITHAFDPYEDESFSVSFEVRSDAVVIVLDEMGLPFFFGKEKTPGETPGLRAMEENMDRVLFINRGREGKELRLTKFLKGRHVEDIFTTEELKPYTLCEVPPRDKELSIRLMKPEESVQVSRCIYRSYRYTYLNEDLYFPERIEAKNRDKSMVSAVAVTAGGEVVAHFALMERDTARGSRHGRGVKVAEIGVAVVIPEYRKRGIMKTLLELLMEEAGRRNVTALFGDAFTMHTLSQRTNIKFGFHETALQLSVIPPGAIRPVTEVVQKPGPGHVITFFKYLREAEPYAVYLPSGHADMLGEIYRRLGLKRIFPDIEGVPRGPLPEESTLRLVFSQVLRTAVVEVVEYGEDLPGRVEAKFLRLEAKGLNALYVDLDLTEPCIVEATSRLEALGFFFSGLLPDFCGKDVLRLQRYTTDVDYSEIETESEFARRLVEYVKALDPRWRALHP